MQAEDLKANEFKKLEQLKHPQYSHDTQDKQFNNSSHNKSRGYDNKQKWNAENEIKASSLNHLLQFIPPLTQDKNIINNFAAGFSKSNSLNSMTWIKGQDLTRDKTLTLNELSTMQTINQLKKTNQFSADDQNSKQKIKDEIRKIEELASQMENDQEKLIKTLFIYYFEAFSAIEVLLKQKTFIQQKTNENAQIRQKMFEKEFYRMRDNKKTNHKIRFDEIMYPPVTCENDFIYIYDSFTKSSRLQLNKNKDIYRTDKPKCMLKLQLAIKDLSIIIQSFIEEVAQSRNLINLLQRRDNIKQSISQYISKINNKEYLVSYQTLSIIHLMCDYVIDTLSQMHQTKSQKQQWNTQSQYIDIKQKSLNYSLDFLSKLSFYNFIVGLYNFFNKKDIPIQILTCYKLRKFQASFVDIKIQFFRQTINNPIRLKRLFSESVNHNISRCVSQLIPASKFNMFTFYQKVYSIQSQQEMIDMYIKYQINFMIFGSEIVLDLIDVDNILFKEIFNYSRFLASNFVDHFIIKTLKIIDNQIYQCHTRFFHQRFQSAKTNDVRWYSIFNKVKERIDFSTKKIYEYLEPPKGKQPTANSVAIQTESKGLLNFFRTVNNKMINKKKTIQEQIDDLKLIYKYLTEIFDKSFFQQDLFMKFFKQLSKNLGIKDWKFNQFKQGILPIESSLRSKPPFESNIQELLKQYKIGQIGILKLFNMFRTLPFYSFANRIEFEVIKKMAGECDIIPKSYKQVLNKLDMLFINLTSRKRIATTFMRSKQTPDTLINNNLQIEYQLTEIINGLYIEYNEKINQPYLKTIETIIHYEKQKFQKYFFIPTKSCISLSKKEQINQSQQKTISTKATKSTKCSYGQTLKSKNQSEQFYNSIIKHPYIQLLKENQNDGSHYNFDINWIMNKHIHKNRLSIFPFKLTKSFIEQININRIFQSQSHKEQKKIDKIKSLQLQINNKLKEFVNQTLNKTVKDFLKQIDRLSNPKSKTQNFSYNYSKIGEINLNKQSGKY